MKDVGFVFFWSVSFIFVACTRHPRTCSLTQSYWKTLAFTYAHGASPVPLYWLLSRPSKWLETGSVLKIAQYMAKNSRDGAAREWVSVCVCKRETVVGLSMCMHTCVSHWRKKKMYWGGGREATEGWVTTSWFPTTSSSSFPSFLLLQFFFFWSLQLVPQHSGGGHVFLQSGGVKTSHIVR